MLKTSWVYYLKKDELADYLRQFQQTPTGTVEEMRKRFAKFVAGEHEEEARTELLRLQAQHEIPPASPNLLLQLPQTGTTSQASPAKTEEPVRPCYTSVPKERKEGRVMVIETVRKWGVTYTGGDDALSFVERLEELADMYELPFNDILPVLSEFFQEKALVWLRNNRKTWPQWDTFKQDFLTFFLPPRYFEKLDDEIRKRIQRPRERFKDYVLALQDLMRHADMTDAQKVERIFRNSQADYQWYIRRQDFITLEELIRLAADLECIPNRPPTRNEHHRSITTITPRRGTRRRSRRPRAADRARTALRWFGSKLTADILIHGKRFPGIVDTGATKSFVTPAVMQKIPANLKRTDVNIEVFLADGSSKIITRAVTYDVTFGDKTMRKDFLVMDGATEKIVLGVDFLQTFNTSITCAGLVANTRSKAVQQSSSSSATLSVLSSTTPTQIQQTKLKQIQIQASPHVSSPAGTNGGLSANSVKLYNVSTTSNIVANGSPRITQSQIMNLPVQQLSQLQNPQAPRALRKAQAGAASANTSTNVATITNKIIPATVTGNMVLQQPSSQQIFTGSSTNTTIAAASSLDNNCNQNRNNWKAEPGLNKSNLHNRNGAPRAKSRNRMQGLKAPSGPGVILKSKTSYSGLGGNYCNNHKFGGNYNNRSYRGNNYHNRSNDCSQMRYHREGSTSYGAAIPYNMAPIACRVRPSDENSASRSRESPIPTATREIGLTQLPAQLQERIREMAVAQTRRRALLKHGGKRYRVKIRRDGTLRIMRLTP